MPPPGGSAAPGDQLRRVMRRLRGRPSRRQLLPLIIRVYAGFSTFDGEASEEEIESSLGFLRYDYPESMYVELRELYRSALKEPQDLNRVAEGLAGRLSQDEKVMLAVQLYVLITRSHSPAEELIAFQTFMTKMGAAAEARGVIGQLNEAGETESGGPGPGQVLEMLELGPAAPADLVLENLTADCGVTVFRFQNLLLLKNTGDRPVIARGRQLPHGGFLRLYEGQRVVMGDVVLDYQDLVFYLNARKGVSSTQLYLGLNSSGSPFVERERSKLSVLLLQFGLQVKVTALKASEIQVDGRLLPRHDSLTVSLSHRMRFPDTSEISFEELRRRAREMGGRFDLSATRTDYLVSNNPSLLRAGDIILSPSLRSEILLRLRCDYDERTGELEIVKTTRAVRVGKSTLKTGDKLQLNDGALISLGEGQYLRCRFGDRIIEEERNIIRQLDVAEVSHRFSRKTPAVEGISFSVRRGEMICVMGPSGSGKSSLLRILAGHLSPGQGRVLLNGMPLYEHLPELCPFISYIPHEDAFDPLLTVEENLLCAAAIRSPHLQAADTVRRVGTKLIELGLHERRERLAGTPEQKNLSSGERKRLNVGMDMITPADVFLFDEPTSGLSSKDSEHVLEIIRGLAHNKIVFVSIHQPSARLFQLFHKAILLDNGGKLVYFGEPSGMLNYFREAWEEQLAGPEGQDSQPRPDFQQPEFIFDVLETPLRDLGGDILYEEDSRGHSAPVRRFSPDFWRDRYQTHLVLSDAQEAMFKNSDTGIFTRHDLPASIDRAGALNDGARIGVMIQRAFLSKFRNRGNLVTTLLEAPLLALLISMVLRYSEDGTYTFASAFHVPTYLFMSLVVAMFLGLTNSADEIIRDRVQLQRERNYNKNVAGYLFGKMLSLGTFALIQNVIYLLIGNAILEIREMFLPHLAWMLATSFCGVAIGLTISSIVRDAKTALNIIPLILIPQIILGGALIKYEEMNRNLDFVYSIRRWINPAEESADKPSNLKVPLICEFMPLRWTYESLILTQGNLNPLARNQQRLNERINELASLKTLSPAQEAEFDHVKEALVQISGLEERNPDALVRRMARIMDEVVRATYDPANHEVRSRDRIVSSESVFENQKIRDLISKAEMERRDFRRRVEPNVFFGNEKRYTLNFFGHRFIDLKTDTLSLNGTMITLWVLMPLFILFLVLRRQLRRV
ncbi:MAG: abc-2 type transporter [Verrucomicrobiales bacterium]|nr:abc-2 type transporter [Verrucomicrobiales bacterium]